MAIEYAAALPIAIAVDLIWGDPRSRYHPTAWLGGLIARMTVLMRAWDAIPDRLGGMLIVIAASATAAILVLLAMRLLLWLPVPYLLPVAYMLAAGILLKTTIAIRGMQVHACMVLECLGRNDITEARARLSMVVKRDTAKLERPQIMSGLIETMGENTVDGISGPLFYYSLLGLPAAFVYRAVNTADSMIGYRTYIFRDLGWFAAKCDTVLNYLPARATGALMVMAAALLRYDWRGSYRIMIRDGPSTESRNAGYPMAAMAGALRVRLEKKGHYSLGDGSAEITADHVRRAMQMVRLTSVLFCAVAAALICAAHGLEWLVYA